MKRSLKTEEQITKKPKLGHWSAGLISAMSDPELKVKEDDLTVTIKDKYPKAKHHYLILPKQDISSLKSVTKDDLALLKHMHKKGIKLTKKLHEGVNFKLGYHAQASMARLHLHVISDDMVSDCVKTKKHWNSFTTEFFLNSDEICESLEENGCIDLPTLEKCKALMDRELKCHKCEYVPKHMPDLKKHLFLKHF